MDLRAELVAAFATGAVSMGELAERYGVAPKTGYKWVGRYRAGGAAGLVEHSRRPHHCVHQVEPKVTAEVVAARLRHPTWGARKVRQWLGRRAPLTRWPSHVTIERIWRTAGLLRARRPPRASVSRGARVPVLASMPNAVWTIDFKGDFRVGNGARCYPLTVRDLYSRFTLGCEALAAPSLRETHRQLARMFAVYGLPACIRSDNGAPFAGHGLGGLTQLNRWWLQLGIALDPIEPGRPDQNGAHEQFHRVLKAHTARPPAGSLPAQQHRFAAFVDEYNTERPHAALDGAVPADRYTPSPRDYPARLPPIAYPGHFETRRVAPNGEIRFAGAVIFLSRALDTHVVGLDETADGIWTIYYAQQALARWDARTQQLASIPR